MAKNISFNIDVNTKEADDSIKSIINGTEDLKKQYKELQTAAQNALDPKVAEKYIKEAGRLRDRIDDVNARIRQTASDTQNLDFVIGSVQGLAGAFTTVQGVMALVGSENEEFEKTIKKVTGSLAILNGLQQVSNTLNKDSVVGKRLHAAANIFLEKTQKLVNFEISNMRKALIATGVGAFVVALGTIIANFSSIVDWLKKMIPGLERFGESLRNIWNSVTDFLGFTSEEGRRAKNELNELIRLSDKLYAQQVDNIEILRAGGIEQQKILEYEKAIYELRIERLDEFAKKRGKYTDDEIKEKEELEKKLRLISVKISTNERRELEKRRLTAIEEQRKIEEKALELAKRTVESIKSNISTTTESIETLRKSLTRLLREFLQEGYDKDIQNLSNKLRDLFNDSAEIIDKRITEILERQEKIQKEAIGLSGERLKTIIEEGKLLNKEYESLIKKRDLLFRQLYLEETVLVSNFYEDQRKQYSDDLNYYDEINKEKRLLIENNEAQNIESVRLRIKAVSKLEEDFVRNFFRIEKQKTETLRSDLENRIRLNENYQLEAIKIQSELQKQIKETEDESLKELLEIQKAATNKKIENIGSEIAVLLSLRKAYAENLELLEKELSDNLLKINKDLLKDLMTLNENQLEKLAEFFNVYNDLFQSTINLQSTKSEEAYKKDLIQLNDYLDKKLITQEEYNSRVGELEAEREKAARKSFEKQKKADIASTTVDTILTAIKTFRSFVETFGGPIGIGLGSAAAAGVLSTGFQRVRQIQATTYDNPISSVSSSSISSGSGGGLNNPFVGTDRPSFDISATGITDVDSQGLKVYVVESDISSVQNRVRVIEKGSNAPF